MITVTLYWRKDCPECDLAKVNLEDIQSEIPHHLVVLDIDTDSALQTAYHDIAPVIQSRALFNSFTFHFKRSGSCPGSSSGSI